MKDVGSSLIMSKAINPKLFRQYAPLNKNNYKTLFTIRISGTELISNLVGFSQIHFPRC